MKLRIFSRKLPISFIFLKIYDTLKILQFSFALKKSIAIFICYLRKKSPEDNRIIFRNGTKIYFSSNEDDIITFMTVFGKREYGKIENNSVVIDIGANIGLFTIYALTNGAKKVISVEPSAEAFETMAKNININNFSHKVILIRKAVTSKDGEKVFIKNNSSPYNEITYYQPDMQNWQAIDTISLNKIFESTSSDISLLKIDCEGSELEILKSLRKEFFDKIKDIRIEYHLKNYSKKSLFELIYSFGFYLVYEKYCVAWFRKDIKQV